MKGQATEFIEKIVFAFILIIIAASLLPVLVSIPNVSTSLQNLFVAIFIFIVVVGILRLFGLIRE